MHGRKVFGREGCNGRFGAVAFELDDAVPKNRGGACARAGGRRLIPWRRTNLARPGGRAAHVPGDREPHRSITVLVAHTHPAAVTIAAPVARPTLFAAVVPAVEVLFLQIIVHARTAMLDTLRSVQSNLARPNLGPKQS